MGSHGRRLLPVLKDCSSETSLRNYDTLRRMADGSFNFDDATFGKRKHDDSDDEDDVVIIGSVIPKVLYILFRFINIISVGLILLFYCLVKNTRGKEKKRRSLSIKVNLTYFSLYIRTK